MFCLKLTSVSCKQTTRFYLKNAIRGLTSPSQTNDYAKTPEHFDIVISGGGMVGTSMACALGSDNLFKNLSIALIESSPQRGDYKMPPIHANRVCALSNKTIELLKSIDSYDFIQKHRFGNVHHMHVWDGKSDALITFKNDSLSNLAIIVENDLIQASLSQNLSKYPNVKVFYSSQIKDMVEKTHSVELKMKDDSLISTKILIGSDGANSFVREKAKFNVMRWNHDQMAIIATLKLAEKGENQTAWQRFLSTGPIALLPLSDEYSSLVWSIKTPYAKELMEIDDEKFVHRVNEAFISEATKNGLGTTTENFVQRGLDFVRNLNPSMEDILSDRELSQRQLPPKIDKVFVRSCFPLSFIHSSHYVKNRIALIGDAAHKIHPLAGQGVNLGFGDVVRLTECLRKNVKNGAEIGSEMYLKTYETERQREVLLKIAGIEAINKLYTDQGYLLQTPLMVLRTAGLTLSNRITPLKSFFVQEAMQ